jgi:Cdc6-like AAA superfamily ATPase
MVLENIDKSYYIETRIKSLNGRKNLVFDGKSTESIEDINNKIQALTNMLEML